MRAEGHVFTQPSPALLADIRKVRTTMLKELQAEGTSFGVKDVGAMVSYYEAQYTSQAR
jgi:hypothetical protein